MMLDILPVVATGNSAGEMTAHWNIAEDRIWNMKRAAIVLALQCIALGAGAQAVAAQPPNILFIMSDDHTTQGFGCYRSRLAALDPTPNIDRLASEGMRFDRVFCTNSICTPSRASIITGQYPQTNGVLDLDGRITPENQHLAHEMKKAGYHTAMIGKWHLKSEPAAFDYYCVLPGQGKYHNPDFRMRGDKAWPGNTISLQGKHSSDAITDLSLDWLKSGWDRKKPFFLMHHFKAPHDLFQNAERYNDYLEDIDIPEPDNLYNQPGQFAGSIATRGENDTLIDKIGGSVTMRCNTWELGRRLGVDQTLRDPEYGREVYQRFLKRYLRCVKGVDDNVKRLVDYLEDNGMLENTVIIYTGDQGFFLGEHDLMDKRWMYEEAFRMPFIVRYPGVAEPGSTNNWLINNTDFAPTILALAGIAKTPEYMQGRSFAAALKGEEKPADWRSETYYRYWMHMAHKLGTPAHFGIRSERFKLIFFYGSDNERVPTDRQNLDWGMANNPDGNRYFANTPPAWEFYDLDNDPQEMRNEYGNPEFADTIEKMKNDLKQAREELDETDAAYPHIQSIIDAHWND